MIKQIGISSESAIKGRGGSLSLALIFKHGGASVVSTHHHGEKVVQRARRQPCDKTDVLLRYEDAGLDLE